jgi:hypothetical protein
MSGLHSIPIGVESDSGPHTKRGNAIPIYKVRHALDTAALDARLRLGGAAHDASPDTHSEGP